MGKKNERRNERGVLSAGKARHRSPSLYLEIEGAMERGNGGCREGRGGGIEEKKEGERKGRMREGARGAG